MEIGGQAEMAARTNPPSSRLESLRHRNGISYQCPMNSRVLAPLPFAAGPFSPMPEQVPLDGLVPVFQCSSIHEAHLTTFFPLCPALPNCVNRILRHSLFVRACASSSRSSRPTAMHPVVRVDIPLSTRRCSKRTAALTQGIYRCLLTFEYDDAYQF